MRGQQGGQERSVCYGCISSTFRCVTPWICSFRRREFQWRPTLQSIAASLCFDLGVLLFFDGGPRLLQLRQGRLLHGNDEGAWSAITHPIDALRWP
jgi:hypothetical protein